MSDSIRARWDGEASKRLVGRRIVRARYMTEDEADGLGWGACAVVLELDDGTTWWPSRDDEGNGPGALHCNDGEHGFPVI